MNDKDCVDEFLKRHNICVIDANKRAHKFTRMNTKYFVVPTDYNVVFDNSYKVTLETEPLYTVEISESELYRLAKFEQEVFNNRETDGGHYRIFESLMEQKSHENYLRNKYPAVKKAFENYSLLLHLAESGEL